MGSAGVIEHYVAEVDRSLRGPARARVDLVTETRDSLTDAAAAYQRAGLDRLDAEHRAVEDFGAVGEVVPAYQAELATVQGRRTSLLLAVVIAVQVGFAEYRWRTSDWWGSSHPDDGYLLLAQALDWFQVVAVAAAVLVFVVLGRVARYAVAPRRLVRGTGIFVLLVLVGKVAASSAVASMTPHLPAVPLGWWAIAQGLLVSAGPVVLAVWSAVRCVAVGSRVAPRVTSPRAS